MRRHSQVVRQTAPRRRQQAPAIRSVNKPKAVRNPLSPEQIAAGTALYERYYSEQGRDDLDAMTFGEFVQNLIREKIVSQTDVKRILGSDESTLPGYFGSAISEKQQERRQALLRKVATYLGIDTQKQKIVANAQSALNAFRQSAGETFATFIKKLVDDGVVSVGDLRTTHKIPHGAWQEARDGGRVTNVPTEVRVAFIRAMVVTHGLQDQSPPAKADLMGARGISINSLVRKL